jgi:hypothetical protein
MHKKKDAGMGSFNPSSMIISTFIRRNLVHSDHMFITNVRLVFKATQFATTFVPILCVTLVTSVHSCIYD